MQNIKLVIEFDGTNYSGWMRQGNKNIPTVQAVLEKAVAKLTGWRNGGYAEENLNASACSCSCII